MSMFLIKLIKLVVYYMYYIVRIHCIVYCYLLLSDTRKLLRPPYLTKTLANLWKTSQE